MTTSTHTKRLVATVAAVAGAIALLAPVAQAQSPDVFTRAVDARVTDESAMLDARERGLVERPATTTRPGPDAFERALITHADEITQKTAAMLDARERGISTRPVGTVHSQPAGGSAFDWSDFGLGAGAGILLALVAGLGAFVVHRSHGRLKTA